MNVGKRELLCSKCRKRVSYHIFKRPAKTIIKDIEIEYEEYYGICDECKSEMFIPGLDDRNEEELENKFRKRKELITTSDIMKILEKYNIEKRPLSKLLGFGELTITRYIDGQLPSSKYSDVLFEVLRDEQKMKMYVETNKEEVSTVAVNKVIRAIEMIEQEKNYNNSAEKIALYIISSGREITNLLLQKVLYYVKAISELFEGESIILEPCEAWKFGPVFPSVYEKYRKFGKQEIEINLSKEYVNKLLPESEKRVTDYVMDTFGIYNAWFLKDLTHLEEPWIAARKGLAEDDASRNLMDDEVIFNYFHKINNKYNLKTVAGVEAYINNMKKEM
jgi:uncharacterized phage-associated protein